MEVEGGPHCQKRHVQQALALVDERLLARAPKPAASPPESIEVRLLQLKGIESAVAASVVRAGASQQESAKAETGEKRSGGRSLDQ